MAILPHLCQRRKVANSGLIMYIEKAMLIPLNDADNPPLAPKTYRLRSFSRMV